MIRELLFSLNRQDFRWETFPAGSKGGQHANKTATAVRCTHPASGAAGVARDSRSQLDNRKAAFRRMAETPEFRAWLRVEIARRTGDKLQTQETGRSSDPGVRVRTYSFADHRVTDHRTGLQVPDIDRVMDGDIDRFLSRMLEKQAADQEDQEDV